MGKRKEVIQREKKAKPWEVLLPTGKWESVIPAGGQGSLLFHPQQPLLPVTTQPPMVLPCLGWPWKSIRLFTGWQKAKLRRGNGVWHPCHSGLRV